jgi:hypothetical protein
MFWNWNLKMYNLSPYGVYIHTMEVLREQAGNAAQQFAITEESWNFIGAVIIVLTITAVPLNTSCNDY